MLSKIARLKTTNILWFHLHEVPRTIKFTETEKRIVIITKWGNGEIMSTEFQFGKMMRKFWRLI